MKQKLDKLLHAHPPIRFIVNVVDVYFTKCVSRAAAELAYFLILTFFPIMICISAFVNELEAASGVRMVSFGHAVRPYRS